MFCVHSFVHFYYDVIFHFVDLLQFIYSNVNGLLNGFQFGAILIMLL